MSRQRETLTQKLTDGYTDKVSVGNVRLHEDYRLICLTNKLFGVQGAERKVRDEERKREKRNKVKPETSSISGE